MMPKQAGQYNLPDAGPPLLSGGPQVSPGLPAVNALVDRLLAPPEREANSPVEHTTASPLVNITRQDIADAMSAAMAFSGGGLGIKAYHGSPHNFERFDASRIGTGEGAQAYGHGLYFAESEPVARSYRDALSARQNTAAVKAVLDKFPGDPQKAAAYLRQQAPEGSALGKYYEDLAQKVEAGAPLEGRMYEVDINADPARMMDWDKPIGPDMAAQIAARVPDYGGYARAIDPASSGQSAYRGLQQMAGKPVASDVLREAGIPGIKYLDQGSRGAGEGSRNYVVFDPRIISIMRKYGIAGAAPLGAGALAAQKEDANANAF